MLIRASVLLLTLLLQQLAPPFHTPWFRKSTRVVAMPDGHQLTVPIGQHLDPTVKSARPDLVARAIVPDVLLPSHSAALGLIFYTGSQFPAEYRNSAFVALHGSINRSKLSGYAVVRVPFRDGKPAGSPENFMSGFIARDDEEKQAWGRPVGLLQMPDGSVLVSDDGANRVWRVSYGKK